MTTLRKPFVSVVETWFQWNIITAMSLALALTVLPGIVQLADLVLPLQISLLASAAVCGILIGLAQAIFLRLEIPSLARWSIASGGGCAIGASIIALLFPLALPDGVVAVTLAGIVLGSCQSFVFSLSSERRAWIVSSTLGWVAAAIIAGSFFAGRGITPTNAPFELIRSIAAGWVLFALVLVFAVLLLFPKQEQKNVDERVRWLP